MRLITAHRILIVAGIVFFLFYAILQGSKYLDTGAPDRLVQSAVSLVIAAGFAVYYRSLRARWDKPSQR